ncbi:hypothetical protein JHK85_044629 [Glycine max]|nr:hypothetical protein JHK85_044629 [Glycine max]
MATATMATAAGAAALLYYTLNRKLQTHDAIDEDGEENGSDTPTDTPLGIGRVSHRLIQAPATWLETISTLSETLRFTYSETLGKWPIGDLAFGISFLLKRQGNYHVDSEFCGTDSVQLKGSEITAELKYLLNLLTLCWHFSKKPFPLFLEETGYSEENVLLREAKAGIVGHSLGGGTAAILTYVLRERKELSVATCVTFAPEIHNAPDLVCLPYWDLDKPINLLQCHLHDEYVVMKRAKSMAQAAWARPNLNLSSWSCMGPRRRVMSAHYSRDGGSSPTSSSSTNIESSDPLLGSPTKAINAKNMNLPVSSSIEEWSSEIECGNGSSSDTEVDVDHDDSLNMMDRDRYEDQMSEVELWHQLEHELYDRPEGEETDVAKEIRKEEAAIAEEVGQIQSSAPEIKEIHRFFPPGKIMHIVTLHSDTAEQESDGSRTSASSDSSELNETEIGIFLTSRSLYSKLRLSQRMISDHFMPVYRRQIERLIKELEEESNEGHNTRGSAIVKDR